MPPIQFSPVLLHSHCVCEREMVYRERWRERDYIQREMGERDTKKDEIEREREWEVGERGSQSMSSHANGTVCVLYICMYIK